MEEDDEKMKKLWEEETSKVRESQTVWKMKEKGCRLLHKEDEDSLRKWEYSWFLFNVSKGVEPKVLTKSLMLPMGLVLSPVIIQIHWQI